MGRGSSRGLLLSGFRLRRTGLEAEAVIPGFKDVAMVGEAVEPWTFGTSHLMRNLARRGLL